MGVYANGHLIYGFVHDDGNDDLFTAIADKSNKEEEGYAVEELFQPLQKKHHVSLFQIGYEGIDVLSAFSASASAKGFDVQVIDHDNIAKVAEYDQNIQQFLDALGIDSSLYHPRWYILGYMD